MNSHEVKESYKKHKNSEIYFNKTVIESLGLICNNLDLI